MNTSVAKSVTVELTGRESVSVYFYDYGTPTLHLSFTSSEGGVREDVSVNLPAESAVGEKLVQAMQEGLERAKESAAQKATEAAAE